MSAYRLKVFERVTQKCLPNFLHVFAIYKNVLKMFIIDKYFEYHLNVQSILTTDAKPLHLKIKVTKKNKQNNMFKKNSLKITH